MFKVFTDSIKYGYAVGRVKVLEKRMLDANRIERIITADNIDEQLKILAETEYAPYLPNKFETSLNIDIFLGSHLSYLFQFLEEITDLPALINFFRAEYDFHNLKALLKAKTVQKNVDTVLLDCGLVSIDRLKKILDNEKISDLPVYLQEPFGKALEDIEKEKNYFLIDNAIDKSMYKFLSEEAASLKCNYLNRLINVMIDGANLKSFIRSQEFSDRYNFLKEVIIDGGELKGDELLRLGAKTSEDVASYLSRSRYNEISQLFVGEDDSEIKYFDRILDNILINEAAPARYLSSGLEPVAGYLIGKKIEIKNLRLLLVGKLNNLPPVEIKDYLRDLYV